MNKNVFRILAAFLPYMGIFAQEPQTDSLQIQRLDEVVVSDSRFELKRENSGKTVVKITAEELSRSQGKSIAEIINTKSGIEIAGSRGREGSVLGVFARGGRGRQVLVVIDGVRVSDPSSSSSEYDLRLLSIANIESIEIIKGAASTLYGTNAATAVINITTKNPSIKNASLNIQTVRGSNQTAEDQNYNLAQANNEVLLGGTLGGFSYQAAFSNRYSEGLSALTTTNNEEDIFSTFATNIKLGYHFTDRFHLTLTGNQTKLKTDYDESFGMIDAPYRFESAQKRAGLSSSFGYASGSLNLNFAYTEYESENISTFPGAFKGSNYIGDFYNKYDFNDILYTILGLNVIKDQIQLNATNDFTIIDPYANVVFISDFGLNLNAGLRLNHHSEYGTHFVYNLNPSFTYKTKKGYLKLLSSYATSYITPSLTQLFGNFGANPNLKPETNRTLEAGVEFANKELRLSTVYFTREEKDFVIYDNITGIYTNASETIDAHGIEFEMNWKPSSKMQITANYTYTERKDDAAIRLPKHKLNAEMGYSISEKTYASLNYALTGTRLDTDFSTFENIELSQFSLLGFYFSQDLISNRIKIFFAMDNVLNEKYVEIIGFTARGRNVRAGMNFTL